MKLNRSARRSTQSSAKGSPISVSRGTMSGGFSATGRSVADHYIVERGTRTELKPAAATRVRSQRTTTTIVRRPTRPAHDWVQSNHDKLKRYRGRWVAVTEDGIVATGDNLDTVLKRARMRKAKDPLTFVVPSVVKLKRGVSARR